MRILYENFVRVSNTFQMKTMKEYHDLYLKCDALLLADVFEIFRNSSLWIVNESLFKCFKL